MALLGPDGSPISSDNFARPRKSSPAVGDIVSSWQGTRSMPFFELPGGVSVNFDTSKLTLGDFRRMSEHPQIASSLYLLTFTVHQFDYQLVGSTDRIRAHCEENLSHIWTELIRALSLSFKFGFSANAVQWENLTGSSKLWINKIKDIIPEYANPRWKTVDGAPLFDDFDRPVIDATTGRQKYSKAEIFNGIRIDGDYSVPVENSLWHPLLREGGDMYGTKLLRTAFRPWFFHNLVMLFANSYYERFGNPLPVGRAPYDEKLNIGTATQPKYASAPSVMRDIMTQIRNRSVVVLPSQRTQVGLNDAPQQDYQIELLEGNLRGAEFEKYLNYLNEEMSLALFTPSLLMRTGSSGSYGQGSVHMQVWQNMLNALAADFKWTIDRYVLKAMTKHNFGKNAEAPTIEFRRMGRADSVTMRAIIQELVRGDKATVDYRELGSQIGLTVSEVETLTEPAGEDPDTDPADAGNENEQESKEPGTPANSGDSRVARNKRRDKSSKDGSPQGVGKKVALRAAEQLAGGDQIDWSNLWELEDAFTHSVRDPRESAYRVRDFVMDALERGAQADMETIVKVAIEEVEGLG